MSGIRWQQFLILVIREIGTKRSYTLPELGPLHVFDLLKYDNIMAGSDCF